MENLLGQGWFARAPRRGKWLVGVSGGADSVALLHLLALGDFEELVVCHVNHGLRGAAEGDAEFVRRLAEGIGCRAEIGTCDVRGRMRETRESMETAARAVRFEFFREIGKSHGCGRLILAHHAEDQAETVLWNLLRGSHGICGMREVREFSDGFEIHRPLLGARKAELVSWLKARGHTWREDGTNSEPVAVRNRLRNEVFPLLREISGRDAIAAFSRLAEDARELDGLLSREVARVDARDPQGRLFLPALQDLPDIVKREIFRCYLMERGIRDISRAMLAEACAMAEGGNPVINLPGGRRLRRKAGRMWVEGAHA